jgi:serine/threonine protein phosphatase PrpC
VVVLCSDGLYGMVMDEDIARIARSGPSAEATQRLVGLSNERGGTDNISVIVCGFVNSPTAIQRAETIEARITQHSSNAS